MDGAADLKLVIPGRAKREPGIHNHESGLWIPGLRPKGAHPGMTSNIHALWRSSGMALAGIAGASGGEATGAWS
jgi:hypothetical protein